MFGYIRSAVEAAGGRIEHIVKINFFVKDPVAPGARWRCRSVLEFIHKASIIIGQPVLLQN